MGTLSLCVGLLLAQTAGAIPPPTDPNDGQLSEQAYQGFQKFCAGCHREIVEKERILGAKLRIAWRLRWIENPNEEIPMDAMPADPTIQQQMLAPENAELLKALQEFVRSAAG